MIFYGHFRNKCVFFEKFFNRMDKYHMALAEVCAAINYRNNLVVWEHTFTPKEYLTAELERRFAR